MAKSLTGGEKIDALDKFGKWYEATVTALTPSLVTVHSMGGNESMTKFTSLIRQCSTAFTHNQTAKAKTASRKFRDFEKGDVIDYKK